MSEYLVAKLSELLGKNEYLFVYDVIEFLGWVNIALVIIAGLLFMLRRMNKLIYTNKNATLKKIVKFLSRIHPYIGITLLITAYIHGELALGTIFKVHTGSLAWTIIFIMMLIALIGKRFRIKYWLKLHRTLAILLMFSVLLHLFARNIL